MEIHYCWRCDAELPFLDETEYSIIKPLLGIPVLIDRDTEEWRLLNQIPLDIFESITGHRLSERSDIHHHRLSLMGPECPDCGHLLRSTKAAFCANCWSDVKPKSNESPKEHAQEKRA